VFVSARLAILLILFVLADFSRISLPQDHLDSASSSSFLETIRFQLAIYVAPLTIQLLALET